MLSKTMSSHPTRPPGQESFCGEKTAGPIHALRHTYASLLIANGESLAYVKEQMGHHSIQITVDVYGHLIPGANRQAVNRLDDPSWREKSGKSATLPQPGKEGERKQTVFQR